MEQKMFDLDKNRTVIKGNNVKYIGSPNYSSLKEPRYLIVHFTASHANAESIANYFSNKNSKASAHFIIDFDGSIIQTVDLNKAAWHAGKSRWLRFENLNSYSIGIEVCNPGPLEILGEGKYKSWFGKLYYNYQYDILEKKHPITNELKGWIPFNERQVDSLLNLGMFLYETFHFEDVLGHDMISLFRKTDPGPCLSTVVYEKIKRELGQDRNIYNFPVKQILNDIKAAPSESAISVVSKEEAEKMRNIKIIDRFDYWFEVEFDKKISFLNRVTNSGYVKISDVSY